MASHWVAVVDQREPIVEQTGGSASLRPQMGMKGPLLTESLDFGLFAELRSSERSNEHEQRNTICGHGYHQDTVQVCVMNSDGQVLANRSVKNRWQAIVAVVEDLAEDATLAMSRCELLYLPDWPGANVTSMSQISWAVTSTRTASSSMTSSVIVWPNRSF